jgi:hypothetical protein
MIELPVKLGALPEFQGWQKGGLLTHACPAGSHPMFPLYSRSIRAYDAIQSSCVKGRIMAVNAVSSNVQSVWQQLQLQQAQRNADQAEQNARALQVQASNAQAAADQAQENAMSLQADADQAQSIAGQANLALQAEKSLSQLGTQLSNVYSRVAQTLQKAQPAASVQARPQVQPAIVNTQGQTIGTTVNTIA